MSVTTKIPEPLATLLSSPDPSNPKGGVLLNAKDWVKPGGDPANCYFQLFSLQCQREFVSISNLFDRLEDCDRVIAQFSNLARRIKRANPFTAVVACTSTARMLVERIHSRLEDSSREVSIHYLGNHPFLNPEDFGALNFDGQRVLIVTDVISSGTLVSNLATVIRHVGGKPIAALAVVVTDQELADKKTVVIPTNDERDDSAAGPDPDQIPLFSLASKYIDRKTLDEIPGATVIEIDPLTVMPREDPVASNGPHSAFGGEEMLGHFKETGALQFGFFRADRRRFTAAIHLEWLLEPSSPTAATDDVWGACQDYLEDFVGKAADFPCVMATTTNAQDLKLLRFIRGRLAGADSILSERFLAREPMLIPRVDTLEYPHGYYLSEKKQEAVKDARVLLVLCSVNTGEKLCNLAALLASHDAKAIWGLCLVNRMGKRTTDFLKRINKVMRGIGETNPPSACFKFLSVYDLREFGHHEIERFSRTIESLCGHYLKATRVPGFRRWLEHDRKYFEFHPVTGRFFLEQGRPGSQKDEMERRLYQIFHGLLSTDTSNDGWFEHALQLIRDIPERDELYKVYGILLTKINRLKISGKFRKLRTTMVEELEKLWAERFRIEDGDLPAYSDLKGQAGQGMTPTQPDAEAATDPDLVIEQALALRIDQELRLLIGIALFSHLDQDTTFYENLVERVFYCGMCEPREWLNRSRNLVWYFSEERVAWALSMILHFSHHGFSKPTTAEPFKARFTETVKGFSEEFRQINESRFSFLLPKGDSAPSQYINKIKSNLDQILAELGSHNPTSNVNVVRFLHSKLIYVKTNHNPTKSFVGGLIQALVARASRERAQVVRTADAQSLNWYGFGDEGSEERRTLQVLAKDALYAIGQLEMVAEVIPRLFGFTPAADEDAKPFRTSDTLHEGLAQNIESFGNLLQPIRERNRFSSEQLTELHRLWSTIEGWLYDRKSFLRQLLLQYVVCLEDVLVMALHQASTTLRRRAKEEGIGNHPYYQIWKKEYAKLSKSWSGARGLYSTRWAEGPEGRQQYARECDLRFALADKLHVTEVLKNLFTNVRHAFPDTKLRPRKLEDLVSVKVKLCGLKTSDDAEEVEGVKVVVTYLGKKFPKELLKEPVRHRTLARHREELRLMGGDLQWGNLPDEGGTWVELSLVKRDLPPEPSDWERILGKP